MIGSSSPQQLPELIRLLEDPEDDEAIRSVFDSTVSRFMRLAAVTAIWNITGDPALYIPICERLLLGSECWSRRYVVELLDEIAQPATLPAL